MDWRTRLLHQMNCDKFIVHLLVEGILNNRDFYSIVHDFDWKDDFSNNLKQKIKEIHLYGQISEQL